MTRRYGKVMVIPCSGIGKAFGTIGREATFMAVEDLRPAVSDTVCLSSLVMGDQDARERVQGLPCVTVDGCPSACARKNVELAGGEVVSGLRVVDTYKEHRELKSTGITELDEAGRQLARFLAEQIAQEVDQIREDLRW
ncbi:MAG: putative zinc-binding protein [Chloroflexi bacterium]|nr:putative zinc-binding protein [Chloroflexota bacterium]